MVDVSTASSEIKVAGYLTKGYVTRNTILESKWISQSNQDAFLVRRVRCDSARHTSCIGVTQRRERRMDVS